MDSPKGKQCPFCAETILKDAKKCKHCYELLDTSLAREEQNERRKSSPNLGVAAVLSFVIPGLGQVYKGQVFNGFLWFVFVFLGYFLIIPGLILHFFCIIGAASEGWVKKKTTVKQKMLKQQETEAKRLKRRNEKEDDTKEKKVETTLLSDKTGKHVMNWITKFAQAIANCINAVALDVGRGLQRLPELWNKFWR